MRKTLAPMLVTLVALLLAALPLAAQDVRPPQPGDDGPNIHFSLVLSDIDRSGSVQERHLETLALAGRAARVRTGWKVAIPIAAAGAAADETAATTAYQYQDIGLSAAFEGTPIDAGRIRVSGRLELSALDAAPPAATVATAGVPQIGVYSHQFEATLTERTATTLAAVPKPDGGTIKLVLTASSRY